ncbi:unnamed protein product [Linum trigynum]|uniref:Wax synthase domain-containing protein n=1 Tax=Linum trigynum TaxID=586398 RepID=A0AAV2CC41_9ROSI
MEYEMIHNSVTVSISILASLSYCHFISSKLPKGKIRLLSILPIVSLFAYLPLLFTYIFPIAFTSCFISWLANFKLLLFAFDKGPLTTRDPPVSLFYFIVIAVFPARIKPKLENPCRQNSQNGGKSPPLPILPLNWPTKALLLAILVGSHGQMMENLHPFALRFMYCGMMFLFVDVSFGACNFILTAAIDVEVHPPSDEPYLSTSLRDFWGRRWNLMVTEMLRSMVYFPVKTTLSPVVGKKWAPLPALLTTFLVSGLAHEMVYYHTIRESPTWEVTWFFVLHGLGLAAEVGLGALLGEKRVSRIHWAVKWALTMGFVMPTSMWLFFPPVIRSGVVDRVVEEIMMVSNFVVGLGGFVQFQSGGESLNGSTVGVI